LKRETFFSAAKLSKIIRRGVSVCVECHDVLVVTSRFIYFVGKAYRSHYPTHAAVQWPQNPKNSPAAMLAIRSDPHFLAATTFTSFNETQTDRKLYIFVECVTIRVNA
jgi:hypothetical protein